MRRDINDSTNETKVSFYRDKVLEYANTQVSLKLKRAGKLPIDITPKYVIYARRSTKGKKRQERSIPDQIAECQNLAKSKDLKVIEILKENESAKKSDKRDVFNEMLINIKKGKYNSIIAWHPDRLARNMGEAGQIIDLLDRSIIVDLQFPTYIFTRDANGLMALGIQFILAKQYSDNLSITTQRGSKRKALEGRAPRSTKYGYILDKKGYFIPDGDNFNLLQSAFKMALERVPMEEIATYLTENDFKYNGKKTETTKQKISAIFQDPFYTGIYIYSDEIIDLTKVDPTFKPMIPYLDFLELRNRYDSSKSFKRIRASEILLRGMVLCYYCQNFMVPAKPTGGSGKRYLRLTCVNNKCPRRFEKKNNGKNIRRDIRSKVIFTYMISFLQNNIQIDRDLYNEYVVEAQKHLLVEREGLTNTLRNYKRKRKALEELLVDKEKALTKIKNSDRIDEINDKITTMMTNKNILDDEIKNIEDRIINIDHNGKSELITYEKFLNFFENITGIIQNSDNKLLVDKVIRMVFLNFAVDDEKVVSHQINPSFEKYIKVPVVLSSRGGEN
ncbi:MAG TPA: recombinase family protein [Candidatus Nitrosocosmicus sp.]|nr:recombinase family protein [Candidatus Nitrosocosmicus sp.]